MEGINAPGTFINFTYDVLSTKIEKSHFYQVHDLQGTAATRQLY